MEETCLFTSTDVNHAVMKWKLFRGFLMILLRNAPTAVISSFQSSSQLQGFASRAADGMKPISRAPKIRRKTSRAGMLRRSLKQRRQRRLQIRLETIPFPESGPTGKSHESPRIIGANPHLAACGYSLRKALPASVGDSDCLQWHCCKRCFQSCKHAFTSKCTSCHVPLHS